MLLSLPTLAEPLHFSFAERLLFAALAVASACAFWRRFGLVLDKILKSKKDPDFHLFPIGKRVRDFVWEVLSRPRSSASGRWPAWRMPWSSGPSAPLRWSR